MRIVLLILAFLGIILFEVPGLIQKKYGRELVAFSAFLLFAFVVSLLQVLDVKLPNPNAGIEQLIKGVLAFFHK